MGNMNIVNMGIGQRYKVECLAPDGSVKWVDYVDNLVTTVGLNDMQTEYWKGSTYTAAHFVLPITNAAGSPSGVILGDTMASHSGWTEVTQYDEAVRQTLTMGTASAGSIDNSASKASFAINATVTVDGIVIATSSTKSETGSSCIAGGDFTGGSKSVDSGDTLNVTVTSTLANS